jgi:hypothetical protein
MSRAGFFVRAAWDDEAGAFVSDSNILGLHIEASTLGEFTELMHVIAPELILANHVSDADFARTPLRDLLPHWTWQPPQTAPAQA